MVHQYKLNGYNIVLDICSGGVHVVDDITYDIIEGFEHETLPIFAVQWHPERLCCEERREGEPSAQPLFDHFIGLCKEQMK